MPTVRHVSALLGAVVLVVTASPVLAQAGTALTPRIVSGGRALEFEFPGLLIGSAEYDEGPTGATVFYFPDRVMATVDVRGGAPGTINTDALRLGYDDRDMSAIVFSGGSWNGLSTATGVADEIRSRSAGPDRSARIIGVAGAIINDFAGGRRFTAVTPDAALGRAALNAARPGWFPLGARGAARFATQGVLLGQRQYSGQGAAYRQIGPTRIAVFTVVNAAGLVVDREGRVMRCAPVQATQGCGTIAERVAARADEISRRSTASTDTSTRMPSGNTTLTLVVTNQKLEWWALQRLASQVHTSMSRGIQPFATLADGDVLYAVTTGEVENTRLTPGELALMTSELAWDAVISSLPELGPVASTAPVAVDARVLTGYAGEYEFAQGVRVVVSRDGGRLLVAGARGGMYVPQTAVSLIPVGPREFLLDTARRDRVRFDTDARGRVTGMTINPGWWAQSARRL